MQEKYEVCRPVNVDLVLRTLAELLTGAEIERCEEEK